MLPREEIIKSLQNKNYDLAVSSLKKISTNDNKLQIIIDKEIFMIFIDKKDYAQAIKKGSELVERMIENIDIEDLVLSETCYNLAVCNSLDRINTHRQNYLMFAEIKKYRKELRSEKS